MLIQMVRSIICMFFLFTLFWATASASEIEFTDVNPDHWGYSAIQAAIEEEIVYGYPDGTFRPEQEVTEAEFLAMFIRAFDEVETDDGWEDWTAPYYELAMGKGWPVRGMDPDSPARNTAITREAVAEIIAAADGMNLTGNPAIQYLLDQGYSAGKTARTIEGYEGKDKLTRAEAVKFIHNVTENGMGDISETKESNVEIKDLGLNSSLPSQDEFVIRDNTYLYMAMMEDVWALGEQYHFNADGRVFWSSPLFPRYSFDFRNNTSAIGISFDPVTTETRFPVPELNDERITYISDAPDPVYDVAHINVNVSMSRYDDTSQEDYEFYTSILEIFGVEFDSSRDEFMTILQNAKGNPDSHAMTPLEVNIPEQPIQLSLFVDTSNILAIVEYGIRF